MLTKEVKIDQIIVVDSGAVMIREATRIFEDGVELSRTYHRSNLMPGQDLSGVPANVQAICNAAWTPEVIAAFNAANAG